MRFEDALKLRDELKDLEHLIQMKEDTERELQRYYDKEGDKEHSERVGGRINQYMIQRGQIMEVIDIIDGLKVEA